MLSKCPGKEDIFKELRVRFVIFLIIIISESFFGIMLCQRVLVPRRRGGGVLVSTNTGTVSPRR